MNRDCNCTFDCCKYHMLRHWPENHVWALLLESTHTVVIRGLSYACKNRLQLKQWHQYWKKWTILPLQKLDLWVPNFKPCSRFISGVSQTFILFKTLHCLSIHRANKTGPTFSTLLRKILRRVLILGLSLTISGKTLTRHNFTAYEFTI